jgi:hypothetical protein
MLLVPLASWGILAYMAYLHFEFGDLLAFAKTQEYWRIRGKTTVSEKALSLLSWEPLWIVYDDYSPCCWNRFGAPSVVLNMQFANPIYFVAAAVLVAVGAWKRWLTSHEVALSIALLAIPYVTRAYEMCLNSHARFAAVVFPAYIVLGHLLARLPPIVAMSLLALAGAMMGLYTALFAAGYPFF